MVGLPAFQDQRFVLFQKISPLERFTINLKSLSSHKIGYKLETIFLKIWILPVTSQSCIWNVTPPPPPHWQFFLCLAPLAWHLEHHASQQITNSKGLLKDSYSSETDKIFLEHLLWGISRWSPWRRFSVLLQRICINCAHNCYFQTIAFWLVLLDNKQWEEEPIMPYLD